MDVKRAITNKEVEALESQQALGGPEKGEDEDDNIDYEFECSDDDESATVMPLLGGPDKKKKKKNKNGEEEDDDEDEIENPLERKVLTAEERLAKRLEKLQKEHEEIERKEREEEEERERAHAEAIGKKQKRSCSFFVFSSTLFCIKRRC
jgi:hypothetical protein